MVLPNRLQQVCKSLFNDSLITPKQLINDHTFYPLFRPFLSKEKNDNIQLWMEGNEEKSILYHAGILQSKIPFPRFLRYCTECAEDNKKRYGEAYWHRSHQIYGVNVCAFHNKVLMESQIPFSLKRNYQTLISLDKKIIGMGCPLIESEKCREIDHKIAKAIHELLTNTMPIIGIDKLGERYLSYLKKSGLAKATGTVLKTEMLKSFHSFFDQDDYLERVSSHINSYSNRNWIDNLLRPKTPSHPLRHVLFLTFLGSTPEEFLKQRIEDIQPFGSGPWICFNAASGHYNKAVITECSIKWGTSGYLVGTFSCSCGFVYSRRGPIQHHDDLMKIGNIRAFGPIWENKLLHLRKVEKVTIKNIAHTLKVTPLTVIRNLRKLEKGEEDLKKTEPPGNKLLYRSNWLQVVNNNQDLTKTALREIAKREYIWLYRHDRKWLENHSPKRQYVTNGGVHVCWAERDREISDMLIPTIEEMKSLNPKERPIRVTISSIGKKLGKYSQIIYGLDKMPITKKILDKGVENVEEFQIRRLQWAIKVLEENGETISADKIRKKASLANTLITENVKQVIESIV